MMTFEDLKRLNRGLYRIDGKEFEAVLAESIGAGREYSSRVWSRFQDDPVRYMSSRVPEIQGQKLFELAWQKGEAP
jgi:hypothetical protein